MCNPIGRPHTGRNHPSSWTIALKNSHRHWINYSKTNWKAKPTPISDTRFKTITTTTALLICPCDKNLGPAIIELHNCIKIAMTDNLLDGRTYRPLTNSDCANHKQRFENEIKACVKKYHKNITKMERAFLKQGLKDNKKAFAAFYLTLKDHKL